MFQQQPKSVPVSKAGKGGRPLDMMSCHERKLTHDVIELRNQQITIKKVIDSMQSDITKLSSGRNLATMALDDPGRLASNSSIRLDDPAEAERLAALVARGSPKTSPLWTAPINQTDDATEVFAKELSRAFEQMEGRLNDEVTRLKGQLNSMQLNGLTDSSGSQLPASTGSASLDNVEAVGEQARGMRTFRDEVKVWKMQTDLKFDNISRKLEKVNNELPLLALKTGRIALRAAEMGEEDRTAALEVVELKEALMEQQVGRRPATQPGEKPVKPSSRQTPRMEFKNVIMELGNVNPLAADETSELGGESSTMIL